MNLRDTGKPQFTRVEGKEEVMGRREQEARKTLVRSAKKSEHIWRTTKSHSCFASDEFNNEQIRIEKKKSP